jgi:acetyl-CoA carboxylase biotin carboxylase subunit
VEFLLAPEGTFYFLEMNTRLQVEHPITEMVTGVDLVQSQILVAAGRELPFRQEDLEQRGHSIEVRICAEDPADNFRPCPGPVTSLRQPGGPWVRIDSCLYPGYEVPVYYDPMLAKLVVWGRDRAAAIERMKRALREFTLTGIRTNIPFYVQVMRHGPFVEGDYDTGYVERHLGKDLKLDVGHHVEEAIIAAVIASHCAEQETLSRGGSAADASSKVSPWALAGRLSRLGRA